MIWYMKRICLIIIAFGDPERKKKLQWLKTNIERLRANLTGIGILDVVVNQYTTDSVLTQEIHAIDANIKVNVSEGYLVELLKKHNQPEKYSNYDHIILLLDDVEVCVDFNIASLIDAQDRYGFDLMSPAVIGSTHAYLAPYPKELVLSTQIEFYFYLFTPKSYKKYYDYFLEPHFTMWGYDLTLTYGARIISVIDYTQKVVHHLRMMTKERFERGVFEIKDISRLIGINILQIANPNIPLAPIIRDTTQQHQIRTAYYGTKDVTAKVRELHDKGIRTIKADKKVLDDPNPRSTKLLIVWTKDKFHLAREAESVNL